MNKTLEKLERAIEQSGVSFYQIAKDTGISRSVFTSWRKRDTVPNKATVKKITDYLGIDITTIIDAQDVIDIFPASQKASYSRENKSEFSIRIGAKVEMLEKISGKEEKEVANEVGMTLEEYRNLKEGYDGIFDIFKWFSFASYFNTNLSTFIDTLIPVDNIGLNMAAIREITGAPAEDVAYYIGMPLVEYRKLESGKLAPSMYHIQKFADFFYLTPDNIVGTWYEMKINDEPTVFYLRWLYNARVCKQKVGTNRFTQKEIDEIIDFIKYKVSSRNGK